MWSQTFCTPYTSFTVSVLVMHLIRILYRLHPDRALWGMALLFINWEISSSYHDPWVLIVLTCYLWFFSFFCGFTLRHATTPSFPNLLSSCHTLPVITIHLGISSRSVKLLIFFRPASISRTCDISSASGMRLHDLVVSSVLYGKLCKHADFLSDAVPEAWNFIFLLPIHLRDFDVCGKTYGIISD